MRFPEAESVLQAAVEEKYASLRQKRTLGLKNEKYALIRGKRILGNQKEKDAFPEGKRTLTRGRLHLRMAWARAVSHASPLTGGGHLSGAPLFSPSSTSRRETEEAWPGGSTAGGPAVAGP